MIGDFIFTKSVYIFFFFLKNNDFVKPKLKMKGEKIGHWKGEAFEFTDKVERKPMEILVESSSYWMSTNLVCYIQFPSDEITKAKYLGYLRHDRISFDYFVCEMGSFMEWPKVKI